MEETDRNVRRCERFRIRPKHRTESTDDELSRSSAPSPANECEKLERTGKGKKSRKRAVELTESEYISGPSTSLPNDERRRVAEEEVNPSLISGKSPKEELKTPPGLTPYDLTVSPNLPPQNVSVLIENLIEKQNSGEIMIEELQIPRTDLTGSPNFLPQNESVRIENLEGNQKSRENRVEE
ncbi:hypothetical protein TNCV_135921 [Trichonephila clavipes]|nr:hypothetical protein TNCV_135921 [Trichonephila clavipes]